LVADGGLRVLETALDVGGGHVARQVAPESHVGQSGLQQVL
jgi:hypothetical protein